MSYPLAWLCPRACGLIKVLLPSEPALIEDDEDKEEPVPLATPKPAAAPTPQSAIDLTAEFLRPLLTPENVANLVRRRHFPSVCVEPDPSR